MSNVSRREVLLGGGAVLAAATAGGLTAARATVADHRLVIAPYRASLVPGTVTEGMMSFAADAMPPVLRLRQGETVQIDVENRLDEASIVHWHGLRVPNRFDGVPYLTQPPIHSGETFRYELTSEDAGTYWYHPHCNTLDQMARGLTGLLVVEEAEPVGFDQDLPLNIRDFRLGSDGQFIDLFKARSAARGGTLGTVSTVNWQQEPVYDLPAGSLVRLRLAVTDVTRVGTYDLMNADVPASPETARVIALDSNPVPASLPAAGILLAPGQRADIAMRVPSTEGQELVLTRQSARGPKPLARFRAVGASAGRSLDELKPLPRNPISEPDLANAEVLEFLFGWTPEGAPPIASVCGSLGYTFWSINRIAWEGDTPDPVGPLSVMRKGRSYILRLRNETPNDHPIHLHGMTFRLLRSNKRPLPPLWTDTALLLEGETMEVALVADNPGDWAFHCHVIEHQKTGLTGYLRVEA
ncbi:multicopper oxidase family protein [Roseibium aestuarii]|uniref:Multicopper oxidase family protein n=1 Tax=Roseibium aestuarii TaxID=2600299 RepID=A0ABW4JT29_9HYPH|nr:multicopper oxidase family protein [Roseibium aestuarii]